jgi:glycosyltransferase involved in cell wall biosynthesis
MCVYDKNNASYFKEALESIVNQSLLPSQIVLVVDGSINDDLQNIINNFMQDCLSLPISLDVIYLEKNKGHGEARRVSIENARHNLIALMDADDISRYERFERQASVFNNNNFSIVGGQIMEISHDTKKEISMRSVPSTDKDIKRYLKTRCPFNQVSVMFKKKDVLKAGNYIDFYHNEDYYLWIRMYLEGFEFYNIPEVLVDVRIDKDFYNRRGGWKYFLSELRLQGIMYKHNIISLLRLLFNSSARFVIQVLVPLKLRGALFKLFFRRKL